MDCPIPWVDAIAKLEVLRDKSRRRDGANACAGRAVSDGPVQLSTWQCARAERLNMLRHAFVLNRQRPPNLVTEAIEHQRLDEGRHMLVGEDLKLHSRGRLQKDCFLGS